MATTEDTLTAEIGQPRVVEAMHRGLVSCSRETPLRGVAHLMASHRVHCIVVFDYGSEADEDRRLWGVVSDRDVASALAAGELDTLTAGSLAAEPLVTVAPDQTLSRAAQLMVENGVGHLVVLDPATHRPAGVVSTLDLARVAAGLDRRD